MNFSANKPFHFLLLLHVLLLQACGGAQQVEDQKPAPKVLHLWCGAPHTEGITIGVQWSGEAVFELRLSPDSLFRESVTAVEDLEVNSLPYYLKHAVDGLKPNQKYYYAAFVDDARVGPLASFHTFAEGHQSFQIALGSCQRTGSISGIFSAMASHDPLFFLQTGDYHYENIAADCDRNYLAAYQANWYSATQITLLRKAPFVYMWDDHDNGPNNSDASAPCRENAVAAYRKYIPHYEQAFGQSAGPVSQSFVVGRVRFVLSDLRSQKVKPTYQDCERLTVGSNFGGEEHLTWFQNELLAAKNAGQVVAWVSSMPFINHAGGPNYDCDENDDWGGYPEERQRIADFIKQHDIKLCILSGDAHMSAIDDGSNSDYAMGGSAPIPVFHAGPLHEKPSYKGGPYSHGYSAAPYQYGLMKVEDNGGAEICVEWKALNERNKQVVAGDTGEELSYRFCFVVADLAFAAM